ncbi:MAG: hypothetical protein HQK55_16860, partial [Deltaproteobacteria bacterium]|nr:hypothetical protein [Deltaproteobacteria bacterium]
MDSISSLNSSAFQAASISKPAVDSSYTANQLELVGELAAGTQTGDTTKQNDLLSETYKAQQKQLTTMMQSLAMAWKGEPFDDVEVLTGKIMKPTPGMKKTILLGHGMYEANKDHPDIQEMLAGKGCPPQPKNIVKA